MKAKALTQQKTVYTIIITTLVALTLVMWFHSSAFATQKATVLSFSYDYFQEQKGKKLWLIEHQAKMVQQQWGKHLL